MNLGAIIRSSKAFQITVMFGHWAANSTILRLLQDGRVFYGSIGLVLVTSTIHVIGSSMDVALKFLSFALVFVVLAAFLWPFADPRAE